MNIVIAALATLLVLYPCVSQASAERTNWDVVENGLHVEMSIDQGSVNSLLPLRFAANGNALDLLSSYYFSAMKNDLAALKQLHSDKDGTRGRLEVDLVSIPNKFEGFKNLKEVKLGRQFVWGNYSAVEVEWITNKLESVKWVELVSCDSKCFISDRLYKPTEEFRFFSALMAVVKRQAIAPKKIAGGVELCPVVSKCENPIRIFSSAKKLVSASFKSGSDVKKFASVNPKYSSLYTMLDAVWKLPKDQLEGPLADVDKSSKRVFECCWEGAAKNELFPFYDMKQIKGAVNSYALDYLPAIALIQALKTVDTINLVGVIETSDSDFVFARLTEKGSDRKVFQMFVFEHKTASSLKLSADAKNFNLRRVLAYPGVIANIDSAL